MALLRYAAGVVRSRADSLHLAMLEVMADAALLLKNWSSLLLSYCVFFNIAVSLEDRNGATLPERRAGKTGRPECGFRSVTPWTPIALSLPLCEFSELGFKSFTEFGRCIMAVNRERVCASCNIAGAGTMFTHDG